MKMYNITPKPRMLIGVQNQKWHATGAIAELVDNSFGPGRGNADVVKIVHDLADHTLSVIDDGQGMEYIGRLFQLGNTIGHTAGDIGHFGSGGTQAIIWLADWVSVATKRNNMVMIDTIKWSDIFDMEDFRDVSVSNEWKNGLRLDTDWDQGTIIKIKLLRERRINVSNTIRDLSRLFAPGLRSGKQIIWQQMRGGDPTEDPRVLTDPFEITASPQHCARFDIVIEVGGSTHLPVNGVISFDNKVSHADSWVRIGFGYREIMRTRDCFKSGDEAYAGIGVSGWLDLGDGWQPYLATTKDAINDAPLYDILMEHVFRNIRELLLLAEQQTVDFELDNIALNLEMALEKTMKMKVKVKREGAGEGGGRSGGGGGGNGSGIGKDKDGNNDNDAIAVIELVKQTDSQMMGVLARSGEGAVGVYVDINKDHTFVREALRQKPVNAAALNLMIVAEIANLLAEKEPLMKKALHSSMVIELLHQGEQEKARRLTRYMMDNIPSKQKSPHAQP